VVDSRNWEKEEEIRVERGGGKDFGKGAGLVRAGFG